MFVFLKEDEFKCRQAGATDFLTKPLNVERLKSCLRNCAHEKSEKSINNVNSHKRQRMISSL